MSEVARQNRGKQKKNIRKQVQQYSNMLPKFPLENIVIRKMIGVKSEIKKDTPLYFDLVDITKEYFKSMEKVQLCSFEKVKQLMLIYVLVDQFLVKLHEKALEAGHLLHTHLMTFIHGAQRKITKWAVIDFL